MEIKSEISNLTSNFLFKNYDIKVEKIEIQNTKKDFDGDITIVLFPFFKLINKDQISQIGKILGDSLIKNSIYLIDFNIVGGFLNLSVSDAYYLDFIDIIKDDLAEIVTKLKGLIKNKNIDVIISTGGTGVTGRDLTPEAFEQVYEKEIPGFGELFRMLSYDKIGTSTIQSRATAGVAGGTYLFALPGSPGACKDAWDDILVHQLDYRFKPCNFVELMPRLTEN